VAVVGVDIVFKHWKASYVCGRSLPYFYDTIIPHFAPFVNPYFSVDLDV
jgi:hypothetical protein